MSVNDDTVVFSGILCYASMISMQFIIQVFYIFKLSKVKTLPKLSVVFFYISLIKNNATQICKGLKTYTVTWMYLLIASLLEIDILLEILYEGNQKYLDSSLTDSEIWMWCLDDCMVLLTWYKSQLFVL